MRLILVTETALSSANRAGHTVGTSELVGHAAHLAAGAPIFECLIWQDGQHPWKKLLSKRQTRLQGRKYGRLLLSNE